MFVLLYIDFHNNYGSYLLDNTLKIYCQVNLNPTVLIPAI